MPEPVSDDFSLLNETLSEDYKKIFDELEEKSKHLCTELEERLIIVTTSLESLRQNVKKEKELWKDELKKTVELERQKTDRIWQNHLQNPDNNQNIQCLDAFIENQKNRIQNEFQNVVYKQQLLEAESMCQLEMIKIRNSLECLAPLQAMVEDWSSKGSNSSATNNGEAFEPSIDDCKINE